MVREAVFLFQVSENNIDIKINVPKEPVIAYFDRSLINQAVTNLVKNASEAIESASEESEGYKGEIIAKVTVNDGNINIDIIDNGCGLPKNNRNRLTEPYMTTREKGTGLGLAIVQRITEQHGGSLRLADAPQNKKRKQGAKISLVIPASRSKDQIKDPSKNKEKKMKKIKEFQDGEGNEGQTANLTT